MPDYFMGLTLSYKFGIAQLTVILSISLPNLYIRHLVFCPTRAFGLSVQ